MLNHGSLTPLDLPTRAAGEEILGIDNAGDVIGRYSDDSPPDYPLHSFEIVRGTRIELNVPGSTMTVVEGISPSGKLVGEYSDGTQTHVFEYANGKFTRVDPTGALYSSAHLITDSGIVAGTWSDGSKRHAFVYDHGRVTSFDGPSTATTGALGISPNIPYPDQTLTIPVAANDAGQIAAFSTGPGNFNDMSFIYDHGLITTINPPGEISAAVIGMNASGDVVGDSADGVFVASRHNFPAVDISALLKSEAAGANATDLLPGATLAVAGGAGSTADALAEAPVAAGLAWSAPGVQGALPPSDSTAAWN